MNRQEVVSKPKIEMAVHQEENFGETVVMDQIFPFLFIIFWSITVEPSLSYY